jgi:isopenicillin N synthase-like dioxygenase
VISEDLEVGEQLRSVTDYKVRLLLRIIALKYVQQSYEIGSQENDEQLNVWLPEEALPGFRKFMTDFYWQCSRTSHEILKAISTRTRSQRS